MPPPRTAAADRLEAELAERERELAAELEGGAGDELEAGEHEHAATWAPAQAPNSPPPIELGSRSLFVGNTGTGKSEACANLFAVHTGQRVLVDVADWYELGPDAGPALEVDDVRAIDWRARTIRYVPRIGTAAEYEDLFSALFQRGRLLVWVDEAEDVAPSSERRRWVRKVYKQGRKYGLTVASATQRPHGVDRAIIGQSEHAFVFPMVDPDDLRVLAVRLQMGVDELAGALSRLPPYGYLRHSLGQPHVWSMPGLPAAALAQSRRVIVPANEVPKGEPDADDADELD